MLKLPIYNAELIEEDDGITAMSLVSNPATEVNWLMFNEEKPLHTFATQEDEHVLLGCVMLADTPIYRRDADGYEYYIQYSKDTIKAMAEKWLADKTHNNIDLMHDGKMLPDGAVNLLEVFIKDADKGISPKGLEDVPDGSLLCSYKVNDESIWQMCKDGEFKGFSLEGYFTAIKNNFNKNNKPNMFDKLKELLKELLVEIDTQEQPAEETELVTEEQETIKEQTVEEPAADPEPAEEPAPEIEKIEDEEACNKKKEMEDIEPEPVEAPAMEEVINQGQINILENEVANLKQEIQGLRDELAKILASPIAQPVETIFEKDEPVSRFGNAKLDKLYQQMH